MKKGFTLIELLAVIVILAIIALIAVPIILEIINNTKEESNKRSIEMYAKAIKNSVAQAQLNSNENISGTFTPSNKGKTLTNDKTTLKVEYDGNVVCDITKINLDGTIYLEKCRVDNTLVKEYIYGKTEEENEEKETLAQYITNLYNNSTTKTNSLEVDGITYKLDTTNNLMDDRLGGTVESNGNIRYYGLTPNNYIDIGDKDSRGNVILWRIIGVFETKYATESLPCNIDSNGDLHYDNCASEKLVKIIRNASLGEINWDSSNRINNWSTATLNTYLNTSTYYPSLNSAVTSKIENVLWNLGGHSTNSAYANDFYEYERGTTRYDTTRPTEWVGKIGLMYPSDYGYAADLGQCNKDLDSSFNTSTCEGTDWLYNSAINQWTLSPSSYSQSSVFVVHYNGYVEDLMANNGISPGVRPVIYLKSDVSIVGEETTSNGISYYVVE